VFTTETEDATGDPDYGYFMGTSASAPVVAGCCALLQSIWLNDLNRPAPLNSLDMRAMLEWHGRTLEDGYQTDKNGKLGKCVDLGLVLKGMLAVPDYNKDDKVGFGDFLAYANKPKNSKIPFTDFLKHFNRRWPRDYPIV